MASISAACITCCSTACRPPTCTATSSTSPHRAAPEPRPAERARGCGSFALRPQRTSRHRYHQRQRRDHRRQRHQRRGEIHVRPRAEHTPQYGPRHPHRAEHNRCRCQLLDRLERSRQPDRRHRRPSQQDARTNRRPGVRLRRPGGARGPFTFDGNKLRVTGAVTDEGAVGAFFFRLYDAIEIRNNQIDFLKDAACRRSNYEAAVMSLSTATVSRTRSASSWRTSKR